MNRSCKVITTCFQGRVVRPETTIIGNPSCMANHSQNFPTKDSVLELLKLILAEEISINPGVEVMDTIIVNNDTGWSRGNAWLDSINGTKTHSGKIIVLNRENSGRSFGGYNEAFQTYKNDYDYWIFTEDDILIDGNKYFSKAIEEFNSNKEVGFLALQGISSDGLYGMTGPEVIHAHGGVGITSTKVLNELTQKLGSLPFADKTKSQEYYDIIQFGEIAFTNQISRLGYKLGVLKKHFPLHWFAWDKLRNISNKNYIV